MTPGKSAKRPVSRKIREAACQFPGGGLKKGTLTVQCFRLCLRQGIRQVRCCGSRTEYGSGWAALAIRSGADNAPTDAERAIKPMPARSTTNRSSARVPAAVDVAGALPPIP